VKLRILGQIEYSDGTKWLPVASAKQRSLLASLIVHGNHVVSTERLLADLWPDRPATTASGLLAGCIWRLRKHIVGPDLLTRAPGYQLMVSPGALDVHDYERLAVAGRASAAAGDMVAAAESFRQALAIWRGTPLADVAMTQAILAERLRLEEMHPAIVEARIEAEIASGRGEDLLPELKQLVAQFPLRERLHGYLMRVLYQCGHQADALTAYRNVRRLLVGELGIEPSKPLRDLHQRILADDPTLTPPSATVACVARAVPGTVVGQDKVLAAVLEKLSVEPVCAVHGLAGSGKTTLLLRAAQALAPRFPDGHVYIDVRGSSPQRPLPASEVMRLCRGKRAVIVLDDVGDVDQVRPLLTPPRGSAVLIGSRMAIEGAGTHVHLGRLTVDNAIELLRARLSSARVDADRAAAADIARLCDHSPLGLHLAAARLAIRPEWSLREFADRLSDPASRLDLLEYDGLSVRASLDAGVRLLERSANFAAMSALYLLGVLDLPVVSLTSFGILTDTHRQRAETIADQLVDAGLVERLRIDSYRIPDMIRVVGRELRTSVDSQHAVSQVIDYHISLVRDCIDAVRAGDRASCLAWYRRELGTLRLLQRFDRTGILHNAVDELRWLLTHRGPDTDLVLTEVPVLTESPVFTEGPRPSDRHEPAHRTVTPPEPGWLDLPSRPLSQPRMPSQ
jgi:DNA-binding SARP family transcriptional activator